MEPMQYHPIDYLKLTVNPYELEAAACQIHAQMVKDFGFEAPTVGDVKEAMMASLQAFINLAVSTPEDYFANENHGIPDFYDMVWAAKASRETRTAPPAMVECPDCEGAGGFETMVALSYDGNQGWKREQCKRCEGTGLVEAEQEMEF